MKLALITDPHANRQALEEVLAHARAHGAEQFALLGDFVGYGADPGWVVDQVRALVDQGAVAVLGNHDAATVRGPQPTMRPTARQAVEWTRTQLDDAQRAFLAALPLSQRRGDALFVHANAHEPAEWEYVQSRTEAVRSLQATDARHVFCGHMHLPMLFHLSGTGKAGDFTPVPGVPIPVPPHRQWLAIPGACGQPRDGNPAAAYAIFDDEAMTLCFHRVPYDHETAAARILAAGLPPEFAQRLHDGR
jgi:diadenosine tetraphosphatase ApaH/serine/threonine PP2A family protein phosphatase